MRGRFGVVLVRRVGVEVLGIDEGTSREENASDPYYPRYIVTVTQFCRQINAQKLLNFAKNYQNSFYTSKADADKKIGAKGFKFRMASPEDMANLSGYEFNAVTPWGMKD